MEDLSGPKKRKRSSSADTVVVPSSSDAGESTGNVKEVHLPHLVVGKILEHLEFNDLRQCSLVNKVWNYEARRLLREKHKCVLAVHLDTKLAQDIARFVKTLTAGLPVPYVGLSIRKVVGHLVYDTWWKQEEYELAGIDIKNFVLQAGPIKVVQLDFRCDFESSFEVYFTRKVLTEVCKTLEVLKIENLGGLDLNPEGFPELKKLEVDVKAVIDDSSVQNVISVSPKLESVGCLSSASLKLLEKLSPCKIGVVKEFTCDQMYKHLAEAAKFARLEPKLEKLHIPRSPNQWWYDPYECTFIISKSLLLSSEPSLINLQVTYEMLEQIFEEKPSASFPNVRNLTVDLPWCGVCGVPFELDRNAAIFAALFPNLEKMTTILKDHRQPDSTVHLSDDEV